MNFVGKLMMMLIALTILVVGFVPQFMIGIRGLRVVEQTESFDVVTGNVSTGYIPLAEDLYQAKLTEVKSISSNISESPTVTAYVEATKVLSVGALSSNATRSLTVVYAGEVGNVVEKIVYPFFGFLLIGACGIAIWYRFFKSRY